MDTNIVITDKAARAIAKVLESHGGSSRGLRVTVAGSGPAGLNYRFGFDWERPGDRVLETNGAKVLIDLKSAVYLRKMELNYSESIEQTAFVLRASRAGKSAESSVTFPFPYSDTPPVPAIW
jgi:iron-sulfur cluster assembly accessory protein